jgi:hypothetical protein
MNTVSFWFSAGFFDKTLTLIITLFQFVGYEILVYQLL